MENSPPGIQAIPGGAGAGGGEEFAIVGPNVVDGGDVVVTAATVASVAVDGEALWADDGETLLA